MISRLKGELVERAENTAIVECAGVGYCVHISLFTGASLPAVGNEVTLQIFTHTNAQDMRISLFGFATTAERELFDLLITVKKVGPSAAMGILSDRMSPGEIARIIAEGNTATLVKIRGVGQKTADLIVVELRDKCELLIMRWHARGPVEHSASAAFTGSAPRAPILEEVAGALVQMGFRTSEAEQAVAALAPIEKNATLEILLKDALQGMPRP